MSDRSLVILPTYNEADNIRTVLRDILSVSDVVEVLVVDDNSPDKTGLFAEEIANDNKRVHLIKRPSRLGLASAYIDGFKFALAHEYTYILQMDADLSHNPKDIPRLLDSINGYDCVVGSRYIGGIRVVNWPTHRLLLSYFANIYARFITGLKLHDLTSGFKCYRSRVLDGIDLDSIHSEGYGFQIELKYICKKKNFGIKEIPIVFSERIRGKSKLSRKIIFEAAALVWKLRFRKY